MNQLNYQLFSIRATFFTIQFQLKWIKYKLFILCKSWREVIIILKIRQRSSKTLILFLQLFGVLKKSLIFRFTRNLRKICLYFLLSFSILELFLLLRIELRLCDGTSVIIIAPTINSFKSSFVSLKDFLSKVACA